MPINSSLDRSIIGKSDQHADRVKRLFRSASTDLSAAAAVRQSLTYLKETNCEKFQELMQDPVVVEIYAEINRQEDSSSQENFSVISAQEIQSPEEPIQQGRSSSEETTIPNPQTHLILTVGTNALPVWVAWYHLSKKLGPVSTQFVFTLGTTEQKKLLECYCKKAGAYPLEHIHTSESSPDIGEIHDKIIKALPDSCQDLHVHYTGGTQAMGVATVSAMQKVKGTLGDKGQTINTDASYLDPGRSGPPKIVSWSDPELKRDTRECINPEMSCESCIAQANTQITDFNCNACLRKVADLNNFEVSYFTSNHPPKTCLHPGKPSDAELCAAQKMLDHIQSFDYHYQDYQGNTKVSNKICYSLVRRWDQTVREKNSDFRYPKKCGEFEFTFDNEKNQKIWQTKILPALSDAYPSCKWNIKTGRLPYPGSETANQDQKTDLKGVDAFLHGFWLEYAAYAAFKKELETIARCNYEIFNNVYVRKKGASMTDKHFELDVVAVLGYQVVVVSCSVTTQQRQIKLKAMEAYHRAKQLGGDEARAVVLCVATDAVVQAIQQELKDETGTKDPLQVWGKCNMIELQKKFQQLLRELHWK